MVRILEDYRQYILKEKAINYIETYKNQRRVICLELQRGQVIYENNRKRKQMEEKVNQVIGDQPSKMGKTENNNN